MSHSDDLATAVEDRRDDLVSLTQALVRIPTVNPPGRDYLAICELLRDRLQPSGFAVELLRAEGTPGDSAEVPPLERCRAARRARPGETVHFNGHIDVVEAGRGWTVDPFGGEVRDGRVYGRGTCDMKGGPRRRHRRRRSVRRRLVRTIPARLRSPGPQTRNSGGYGGVAWLAERGYFSPERVQHVVIPEPLDPDRICLGHRGVWWGEIEDAGRDRSRLHAVPRRLRGPPHGRDPRRH